ncbi:DEAD/DEAH box helicase [Fulvivirga sediminis]|uniref:DEAD/DEAH box helicase n=1 Tax=Fulvivirga sediminis TaxID=2803949 RepID=A0A937F838_9BACT|nr:DEAD/DEAH box helicase [Fulvivirga sediminis]MBL3655728.1 DEAD/DEAH box helicase [Fulvivirga sediminis]
MKFKELGLDDRLLEGISAIGFEDATPVQEQAIPKIISGKDIIASAQTGTGKTAAFLLPVIHQILQADDDQSNIKALIIVPTRELAVQIDQQMEGLSYFTSVSSIAVYGGGDGQSFSREKSALSQGADVIIGTPGRLIAHLNLGYVQVSNLKCLVLDEADRMLDMGFHDDLMKIISYLPKQRQNLMFSATMPPKIRDLARKILQEPDEINIAISKPAERVAQAAFILYDNQKIPLAKYLLKAKKLQSVIIFCSTKNSAKQLSKELKKLEFSVEDIHSDLEQGEREQVLRDFKNKKLSILVATDILSRGIDVEDIELVVNYDVPNDGEDYIHRIGRTARAASKGVAFTFVNEKEQNKFYAIEKLLETPVPKGKLPASIGEGPEYKPRTGSRSNGRKKYNSRKKRK